MSDTSGRESCRLRLWGEARRLGAGRNARRLSDRRVAMMCAGDTSRDGGLVAMLLNEEVAGKEVSCACLRN
jgi:hypothetical protein